MTRRKKAKEPKPPLHSQVSAGDVGLQVDASFSKLGSPSSESRFVRSSSTRWSSRTFGHIPSASGVSLDERRYEKLCGLQLLRGRSSTLAQEPHRPAKNQVITRDSRRPATRGVASMAAATCDPGKKPSSYDSGSGDDENDLPDDYVTPPRKSVEDFDGLSAPPTTLCSFLRDASAPL